VRTVLRGSTHYTHTHTEIRENGS